MDGHFKFWGGRVEVLYSQYTRMLKGKYEAKLEILSRKEG